MHKLMNALINKHNLMNALINDLESKVYRVKSWSSPV